MWARSLKLFLASDGGGFGVQVMKRTKDFAKGQCKHAVVSTNSR